MYTYNTLIADLQAVPADDDVDYVAALPMIIKRAEQRLLRDLQLELLEDEIITEVASAGSRYVDKPAGVVLITELWARDPGQRYSLIEDRGFSYCVLYAPVDSMIGVPKYFAEMENQLFLSPTPDIAYPLRIRAIVRPDGLAPANQSTWLSTHAGDCLLQAALFEAHQFLKNKERLDEAASMYASLLPVARAEADKVSRRTYAGIHIAPAPPVARER